MLLSITDFIGRFHPVLVHLPIGILLVGILLQWLSAFSKYNISVDVIKIVLLIGTATALLSCITGYLLSGSGDYDEALVSLHMWMGVGVAFTSLLFLQQVLTKKAGILNKLTSISLLMLIVLTGHLGGSLTHGSDYLTGALHDVTDTVAKRPPITNVQESMAYADVIQPLLQTKCYACHNAQKQKGGLRMDDPRLLMKGGKNGEVIQPGKGDESEIIKRVLLPEGDEHHMPPKSKPQLNEREVALLHWWINTGADFNKKVTDLPQPEAIKPALIALQKKPPVKAPLTVPIMPVEKADEAAIKTLKDVGAVVVPVAQGSNYLSINFVTVPRINDETIKLLLPLKKQLVWLKLNDTKLSENALAVVSECKGLTILYLNNTAINDKGLLALKGLDSLQLLSMVNTGITAYGLLPLASLKNLQALYIYGTGVKETDTVMLRKSFPKTRIDIGGYLMPFIESDTARIKAPKAK